MANMNIEATRGLSMEYSWVGAAIVAIASLLAVWVSWGVLNWVWIRPRKLQKWLKKQGLAGNPYRILHGDLKERSVLFEEANAKPVAFSHDIGARVLPSIYKTIQNYGKSSYMWLGPYPRVHIMDPDQLKATFSQINDIQKPDMNPLIDYLLEGIITHEGEKWAKHRKIINPAFQLDKLKGMVPAFVESSKEILSEWERIVPEEGCCELNVMPYLQDMTCDAISRTAFGSSYKEGQMIFQLLKQLIDLVVKVAFGVYIPGWRFLPTKSNKKLKEINEEIKKLVLDIINKRQKAMKEGEAVQNDLLGILLDSNAKEIEAQGNNKDFGMSIEDVIKECKIFYIGGQETTAQLLTWTMILLSFHTEWQERARAEVREVFGNDTPNSDGLNRLKVVNMILHEVLRLYPPASMLLREVKKETSVGKLNVPAGVMLIAPVILIHRDREIWGEDANEFKPERFSNGVSKASKLQPAFFPFGWGPRICMGQNFAIMEAKVAMSLILQRFSFELSPSYAHAPTVVMSVQPQHGAHIILRKLMIASLIAVWVSWGALNWVWIRPRKLEKRLREQGLAGNPYRILHGDNKESLAMLMEAYSKPMAFSHDIGARVVPSIYKTIQNYGKNSYMWVGPCPRVHIMDPEQLKATFSLMDDIQKPDNNPLIDYLLEGIISHEGQKWAKHRKLISPAFHMDKLKNMVPAFVDSSNEILSEWERIVPEEGCCELDVMPYLQNLSRDAISRTAFGSSYKEGQMIFQLIRQLIDLVIKVSGGTYIPGWRFLPTKSNNKLKETNEEIKRLVLGIINKRQKAMKEGEAVQNDLLGILLDSNAKEIEAQGNNKDVGMSIEDVIKECKIFYIGGQETTAQLLTWSMILLSVYTEWQERARAEVREVFGDNTPNSDGLSRLKVVNMILHEVLRLYPPASMLPRVVKKETRVGKLNLPAGVMLVVPMVLIHRDREIWGEDANEFKPERFSNGVSNASKQQPAFLPFGWGPRICLGQNFAIFEAKIALSLILQRFSFELSPSYTHAPIVVMSIEPQHGAHIILRKLNKVEYK
ncbi:uncharacterized protein LOC111443322 isoform X1 [Cucurbita moschata]|uniref:Uncharacterized protein LOC111443322 isoform X1 n=1 Tax=Cucurbita moschata TaxID=3662 RepID=A0A6J1FEF2_CUCMO|nr:uncharacterized protein LOC111443322 isoform X1 [Cucurbita moschata]